MDAVQRALLAFKVAVLRETEGDVLHLNACLDDVDVYSAVNARRVRIIATSPSAEAVRRMASLVPTRPAVHLARVDLAHEAGSVLLQHLLAGAACRAVVWRLGAVVDLPRVVQLVAAAMQTDAILYLLGVDTAMVEQLVRSEQASAFGAEVSVGGVRVSVPLARLHDVHAACLAAGLRHIFSEQLDTIADRLGFNLLPADRVACSTHSVRAYQAGVVL